jgi:hypothetical protein
MAQTILELKVNDGLKNTDNSYFQTVYGEPIRLQKGSTVDFLTGFLDLGAQSQNLIEIPTNLQLGIEFYRYEYDVAKVPAVNNTDAPYYSKRTMYFDQTAPTAICPIDPNRPGVPLPPLLQTFGDPYSSYAPTNLPAFLLTRTTPTVDNDVTHIRTDVFAPLKQIAYININKGSYTKLKITQIINDEFNLIQGTLTNTDKPAENKAGNTSPTDYQIPPNNKSALLTAYQYSYTIANYKVKDPVLNLVNVFGNNIEYHANDKTWDNWFFPIYTTPTDQTNFIPEQLLPYVWMLNGQSGFLAGTTKFSIQYDPDNDLFFIDYTHSPIIDQNQKEVVIFSRSKKNYAGTDECIGYKANGSMGGIIISRLYSYQLDDNMNVINNKNTGFWQNVLGFGFDDAASQQFEDDFITENLSFAVDGPNDIDQSMITTGFYNYTITYPDPKYLKTNATDALIPIQWLQQSNYTVNTNDEGMSIKTNDLPKVFESIGNRPIYGDAKGYNIPNSHYLIEVNINHLINNNYRDKDSYYQIMCIAGKTYASGTNYIQTFDDGGVQSINIEEDIYIDKIEIRVLNPDKTLATGLGSNTTFFLKLTQPVTLGI